MAIRVLFLDFDFVLNSHDWWARRDPDFDQTDVSREEDALYDLDPLAVARLDRLIRESGCKVVTSSSWRMYHNESEIVGYLVTKGLSQESASQFIGYTPRIYDVPRGEEIRVWLENHPEVEGYAILDDNSDMLDEQLPHFIQTTQELGLQDEHVERAKMILCTTLPTYAT